MGLSTVDAFKHIQAEGCVVLDDRQLKKLQRVLLGIFLDIISVCQKHNIRYYLSGGTALGAVRHQGFIPWDDDIDINMPRRDYLRFAKIFAEEMGDKYWVHTPDFTEDYNLLLGRVRKKGTCVKTKEDFSNDECGAFVDIFIIENTYTNPLARGFHGFLCLATGLLQSCRKFYQDRKELLKLVSNRKNRAVFMTKIAIGFCVSFFSVSTWTKITNRCNAMCKNTTTDYVTIPSGRKHFFGEVQPREDFLESVELPFEGTPAKVCKNYDRYLTALYGDYMTPPTDHKESHVFLAPFDIEGQAAASKEGENDYAFLQ